LILEIGCGNNCRDPQHYTKKSQKINGTDRIHKNKLSDASIFVKAFLHRLKIIRTEELTDWASECKLISFEYAKIIQKSLKNPKGGIIHY
jgi:hypothetical protein